MKHLLNFLLNLLVTIYPWYVPPAYHSIPDNVIVFRTFRESQYVQTSIPPDADTKTVNAAFRKLFYYMMQENLMLAYPLEYDIQAHVVRIPFNGKSGDALFHPAPDMIVVGSAERRAVSIVLKDPSNNGEREQDIGRLEAWLQTHPAWTANGTVLVVYWQFPDLSPRRASAEHFELRIPVISMKKNQP